MKRREERGEFAFYYFDFRVRIYYNEMLVKRIVIIFTPLAICIYKKKKHLFIFSWRLKRYWMKKNVSLFRTNYIYNIYSKLTERMGRGGGTQKRNSRNTIFFYFFFYFSNHCPSYFYRYRVSIHLPVCHSLSTIYGKMLTGTFIVIKPFGMSLTEKSPLGTNIL